LCGSWMSRWHRTRVFSRTILLGRKPCCSVLQWVAVCCISHGGHELASFGARYSCVEIFAAVCCRVLHSSVLQGVANVTVASNSRLFAQDTLILEYTFLRVCVCLYVYVCGYTCLWMCICMCMCMCMYVCEFECVCVCECVCICVCVCMSMRTWACTCVYTYLYEYMRMCVCACAYVVYLHIHIHIYICINLFVVY